MLSLIFQQNDPIRFSREHRKKEAEILGALQKQSMNIENRRMAGEGEGSAGVGSGSGGGDESGASSPKNKVKFLCSHGGKVLPRPSDGLLKYVGGETRVISVPRTLTFSGPLPPHSFIRS